MAVGSLAPAASGSAPAAAEAGCFSLPRWLFCKDAVSHDAEQDLQMFAAVELLRFPSVDGVSTEEGSNNDVIKALIKRYGVTLPETTRMYRCPEITNVIKHIPQIRRVVKGFGVPSVVVGGAVRDLLTCRGCKDVDLNIALTKEEILAAAQKFAEPEHIKVNALAITIGPSTPTVDAIDCLPFAQMSYDPEYAENDVNSLMYDPTLDVIIDPFGTGMDGVATYTFRIPTEDFEAWYRFKIPGRANNGKVPRLFKMLIHGFKFRDLRQQAKFNRLCDIHFRDLVDVVIAGKFSTLAMVLLMNIRGDSFDFKTGCIKKSADAHKLKTFDALLRAMEELNPFFHWRVITYVAKVEELRMCPPSWSIQL